MPGREYVGQWWTPSAPEAKLLGTLTVSGTSGPRLEVVNDAREFQEGSLPALARPTGLASSKEEKVTVHGQAQAGELFTLYDGFVHNSSIGMGSVSTASLYFNRGFEGACIDNPVTLPVETMYMRYPGMDAWINAHPFDIQVDQKRACISHEMPDRESFRIDERRRLILVWERTGPNQSLVQTRVRIRALPWLGIEYSQPVSPEDASDDASVVGEMLTLFLGAATTSRQLRMLSPECTLELSGEKYPKELKVLCAYFTLPESLRKWLPHDVLVPLAAVRPRFERLLQRWFELRRDCWAAIVPYLASQRSPAPLADRRFFDFASVAESLHRHLRPQQKKFDDNEAKSIRRRILADVPPERHELYAAALARVNELTYRERLEQLLERFPVLTNDVIGDASEQAGFCKLVTALRNVEAHRLTRTDQTNVGGSQLGRISSKLKVILDAWILSEMGVDESVVEDSMRKNHKYWFYASHQTLPWK